MSALTTETAEETEALAEGKNVLAIMDASGDTRIMWDPANRDEVASARAAFDAAMAKGMRAYHVKKSGEPGKVIREFPSEEGKVIMAPALVGG